MIRCVIAQGGFIEGNKSSESLHLSVTKMEIYQTINNMKEKSVSFSNGESPGIYKSQLRIDIKKAAMCDAVVIYLNIS